MHTLVWFVAFFPWQPTGAHRALRARCVKSRLFSTTGSYGSQGPDFRTLQPLLVHQGFFVLV